MNLARLVQDLLRLHVHAWHRGRYPMKTVVGQEAFQPIQIAQGPKMLLRDLKEERQTVKKVRLHALVHLRLTLTCQGCVQMRLPPHVQMALVHVQEALHLHGLMVLAHVQEVPHLHVQKGLVLGLALPLPPLVPAAHLPAQRVLRRPVARPHLLLLRLSPCLNQKACPKPVLRQCRSPKLKAVRLQCLHLRNAPLLRKAMNEETTPLPL